MVFFCSGECLVQGTRLNARHLYGGCIAIAYFAHLRYNSSADTAAAAIDSCHMATHTGWLRANVMPAIERERNPPVRYRSVCRCWNAAGPGGDRQYSSSVTPGKNRSLRAEAYACTYWCQNPGPHFRPLSAIECRKNRCSVCRRFCRIWTVMAVIKHYHVSAPAGGPQSTSDSGSTRWICSIGSPQNSSERSPNVRCR